MILTFRGLLPTGNRDTLRLSTNTGTKGYRIVKFEIMSALPYQAGDEHIVKIYKTEEAVNGTINFSDSRLLAAAIINNDSAGYRYTSNPVSIFDKEIFNQDIYVTHHNSDGTSAVNYYIELEGIKLDSNETAVATLKNIKNRG